MKLYDKILFYRNNCGVTLNLCPICGASSIYIGHNEAENGLFSNRCAHKDELGSFGWTESNDSTWWSNSCDKPLSDAPEAVSVKINPDDTLLVQRRMWKLDVVVLAAPDSDISHWGLRFFSGSNDTVGIAINTKAEFRDAISKTKQNHPSEEAIDATFEYLTRHKHSITPISDYEVVYGYAPAVLTIKKDGVLLPPPYKASLVRELFTRLTVNAPFQRPNKENAQKDSLWNIVNHISGYGNLNTALAVLRKNKFLGAIHSSYKNFDILNGFQYDGKTKTFQFLDAEATTPQDAFKLNKNVFKTLAANKSTIGKREMPPIVVACRAACRALGPQNTENILNAVFLAAPGGQLKVDTILKIAVKYKDYKPDIAKICNYLMQDIDIYQGISTPDTGLTLLDDYYSLCEQMGVKPAEWCPRSLKLTHDIAARNLKVLVDAKLEAEFQSQVTSGDYTRKTLKGEEWSIIPPSETKDLIDEGRKQNHCVDSYVKYVAAGERQIYFLRRSKAIDVPVLTLEVRNGTVTQCKGAANRDPKPDELAVVTAWARKNKLPVSQFISAA